MKIEVSFDSPLRLIHSYEQAPPASSPQAIFTIEIGSYTFKGENLMATMSVGTYATVSVQWKDMGGNIVGVEKGSIKWASSNEAVCTVEVSTGNPQIANLYAPSGIGSAVIQATGDADLGQGVKPVTASLNVDVIGGQAVGGEISFSQTPAQGNPPQPQHEPQHGGGGKGGGKK